QNDVYVIFFFQAEDGIRDFHVTGVQTCALPIYFEILDADQEKETSGTIKNIPLKGDFKLNNVSFEYPNGTKALFDINMEIKANKIGRASCRERVQISEVDGVSI